MKKSTDLEKAIKELKNNANKANFDSLLEKVLLLKEEELKQNSLVYVAKTEDMQEIKQSAYSLTKADKSIVYHITGLDMVIRPQLGIYHSPYSALFDLAKDYDKLSDSSKESYENLLYPAVLIPQIPTFAFHMNRDTNQPDFLVNLLKLITEHFTVTAKEMEVFDETPEEIEKNLKFEQDELIRESLKKSYK